MPRTKLCKRKRQLEQLHIAEIKLQSALEKIDELGKRRIQQVNIEMQLILASTHQNVLLMKWSEFLKLKLDYFNDYLWKTPAPPKPRSRSISTRSRTPKRQSQLQSRPQTQSVDRAALKRNDLSSIALLRWPKPGELALSKAGSPLAVQTCPDRCANVHIPTKAGVLKLQPQKMSEVKREVLQQLDSATLNQIKTLKSNLHMIVHMASKINYL